MDIAVEESMWACQPDEKVREHLDTLVEAYNQSSLVQTHAPLEIPQDLWDRGYMIAKEETDGITKYYTTKGSPRLWWGIEPGHIVELKSHDSTGT